MLGQSKKVLQSRTSIDAGDTAAHMQIPYVLRSVAAQYCVFLSRATPATTGAQADRSADSAEADAATMLLKKNVYQGLVETQARNKFVRFDCPACKSHKLRARSALHAWFAPCQTRQRSAVEQRLD